MELERAVELRARRHAEALAGSAWPTDRRDVVRFVVTSPAALVVTQLAASVFLGRRPSSIIALTVLAGAICLWLAAPGSPSASAGPRAGAPHPSAYAKHTIPPGYLQEYWKVAREYGLDWTKLAAVGQIESDHGRSAAPGVRRGTNGAGAAGPRCSWPPRGRSTASTPTGAARSIHMTRSMRSPGWPPT